jgi:hypothetical protein
VRKKDRISKKLMDKRRRKSDKRKKRQASRITLRRGIQAELIQKVTDMVRRGLISDEW